MPSASHQRPAATGAAAQHAPHRVSTVDWAMLGLALVSIGLLVWETIVRPGPVAAHRITIADNAICAVFLAEFLYRWRADGWRRNFPLRNWYDILGMIPVSSAALRGLRLLRVVRIAVLLSRFGMAADRAAGEEFTYRLVNRFRNVLVDAVSDTVTIAVMDQVADVLHRGTYTKNIVVALEQHETELRGMIREKLRQDSRTGRLARLPFYDSIVNSVLDSVVSITRNILTDPRTDALIADVLRDNIGQLKEAIRENNAPPQQRAEPRRPDTAEAA